MTVHRPALLHQHLRALRQYSPAILGSLILTGDGYPIASDLPTLLATDRVAEKAAAMVSLSERVVAELMRGELSQVFLQGDDGYVIIQVVTENTALAVVCRATARMPLVLLEIDYTLRDLRPLLVHPLPIQDSPSA